MRRRLLTRAAPLATSLLVLLPSLGRAQPPQPPSDAARATARALAREGYDAQKRGQYALAADRFERAEELVDAPTLLLGLARAQVGLGKLVEADETYRRILREPLPSGSPAPFVKAVEEATREGAAVAARRAWVTLLVQGAPEPQVTLDDVAVPGPALGVKLACNAGSHVLKASAPGFLSAERSFAIAEGSQQTVSLALQPKAVAKAPAETEVQPAPTEASAQGGSSADGSSFRSTFGVPILGVGIAGLAVGSVTGVIALSRHASLSDSCPGGHCPSSESGSVTTYRALADVSTVALIAGVVCAGAGIAILLTGPKQSTVGVYAGPLSASVAGTF